MAEKIKLLIADDEESIREKLALWLSNKDYEVETSADGKEAIEMLKSFDAKILITDLKMPEIDGIHLIKECRVINPNIGIIVITGHGDVDTYIETLSMGVFEFLNKPFGLGELGVVLKKLVQKMEKSI